MAAETERLSTPPSGTSQVRRRGSERQTYGRNQGQPRRARAAILVVCSKGRRSQIKEVRAYQ